MNILINYADKGFFKSQTLNSVSGLHYGFDKVINYTREDLKPDFVDKHNDILSELRGAGYWLWKPYIILDAIMNANDNDIIFYCDAGSMFIDSVQPLLNLAEEHDMILFNVPPEGIPDKHYAYKWTKKDVFIALDCDTEEIRNSEQIEGGFQIYKKTPKTIAFLKELLYWSGKDRLITDDASIHLNIPGFKEHRHDQSILTLLAIKNKIKIFRDPTQFGNEFRDIYPGAYDQIIDLHRRKT